MLLLLLVLLAQITYVASRCPVGTIQGLQPENCYVRRTDPVGWFDAEENCRKLGGHLASITSGFQNAFLAGIWDGMLPHYFWIGGSTGVTSSSQWDWTDGSAFRYTNWEQGQPTADSGERCLLLLPSSGQWHSNDCSDQKYYVCAVPPVTQEVAPTASPQQCRPCCPSGWTLFDVTGKCYKLVHNLRWNDALAACETMNATLASIHSDEENNWLADFASTSLDMWNRVWFGLNNLRQTGSFEFTDGTKLGYTNWGPAMPQSASETDCVFFHTDAPVAGNSWYLKWSNDLCDYHGPTVYAAIC